MRKLELLAPAKNLACGIAAIDHGADAVYIGPSSHGARAAAGNSTDDIRALCDYAHRFSAKVFATVNTLIRDDEVEEVQRLVDELAQAGVDALLVQDWERFTHDGIPLHASTQTDNRTVEKVKLLRDRGFRRVVLARELSLEEIRQIHSEVPDVELEVFVHGALCVSYSGLCYASEHCFGRSANRGECAQVCRLKFDLLDADGRELIHQRHLLSLKDMCRIDHLEALADAGCCSFKIEGRLKDEAYVKNVVAAYSQRLDQLIEKRPQDYCRASVGRVAYSFTPDLRKTFNRGYTDYFLFGRRPDIASPDTPKAIGEPVGKVKELQGRAFTVAGTAAFSNGDGLCFFDRQHELQGFRVNRVEGNRLFPLAMPAGLQPGMTVYRNHDAVFERVLSGKTAERKIPVALRFEPTADGFRLTLRANGVEASTEISVPHESAHTAQTDNLRRQLGRLGSTSFVAEAIEIAPEAENLFVPSSRLAEMRRRGVEILLEERGKRKEAREMFSGTKVGPRDYSRSSFLSPLSSLSEAKLNPQPSILMQCRHCLRYSLGFCVKNGGRRPEWKEPLSLRMGDGRRFRLEFKCKECQMNLYAE